jgi:hypothetical protein
VFDDLEDPQLSPGERRPTWRLVRFIPHLDRWVAAERPNQDLRLIVTGWVMARHDDPFAGVRRAAGQPMLWSGPIPGTEDEAGSRVLCGYFVFEANRVIRCHFIGRGIRPP